MTCSPQRARPRLLLPVYDMPGQPPNLARSPSWTIGPASSTRLDGVRRHHRLDPAHRGGRDPHNRTCTTSWASWAPAARSSAAAGAPTTSATTAPASRPSATLSWAMTRVRGARDGAEPGLTSPSTPPSRARPPRTRCGCSPPGRRSAAAPIGRLCRRARGELSRMRGPGATRAATAMAIAAALLGMTACTGGAAAPEAPPTVASPSAATLRHARRPDDLPDRRRDA